MNKEPKYLVKFTNAYNDNGTVWYTVQVLAKDESWTFKERYSRMRTIHENCEKGKYRNDLPAFPPRKLFGNTSEQFIQKRKKQLENYYSTLFRTVDIEELPEVLAFFNTNKPVKSKPKPNDKNEPTNHPQQEENNGKKNMSTKRVFEDIVIKYEKEMVESNEFDNDIEDETRRKFNIEFQKLKLDLKSRILDLVDLPKGDKENDTDFWNQFFIDSNQDRIKHSELISKRVVDHLQESSKCDIKFVVAL